MSMKKREDVITKNGYIILVVYAVVLFAVNLLRIFDNVFWADECYSIGLVRMNFGEMIRETGADVHPPLYYIILKAVCLIFGEKGYAFHLV